MSVNAPAVIDLKQLLLDCHVAQDRMSRKNPHKHLLVRMEMALMIALTQRSEHLRAKAADAPSAAD